MEWGSEGAREKGNGPPAATGQGSPATVGDWWVKKKKKMENDWKKMR